jgi:hypothetical protein
MGHESISGTKLDSQANINLKFANFSSHFRFIMPSTHLRKIMRPLPFTLDITPEAYLAGYFEREKERQARMQMDLKYKEEEAREMKKQRKVEARKRAAKRRRENRLRKKLESTTSSSPQA